MTTKPFRTLLCLLVPLLTLKAHASQIVNPAAASGGGTPGGSNYNVQVASAGAFAGVSYFNAYASSAALAGTLDMKMNTIANLADGTTSAAAATFQQSEWPIAQNILKNGGMEIWRFGTAIPYTATATAQQAMDGWTFTSASRDDNLLTISREATTVHDGQYSMKLLGAPTFNAGDGAQITQSMNAYDYAGSSVSLSAWINASINVTARLTDDTGNTDATYTANSGWQRVTSTKLVKTGNTTQFIMNFLTTMQPGATVYIDSVLLSRGDVPFDWIPRPFASEMAFVKTDPNSLTGDTIGVGNGTTAATTGDVGEYIETGQVSGSFPAAGAAADAGSISLTAGDWDVMVQGNATNGQSTVAAIRFGASTTSGNSTAGLVNGVSQLLFTVGGSVAGTTEAVCALPRLHFTFASTTTVYMKVFSDSWTTGAPTYIGNMSARRMR
jgi:hypothetical protein